MARTRKTIERETIVANANEMIAHLASSGTQSDKLKREAIIAATSSLLLAGNSYKGFRYLDAPTWTYASKEGWETMPAYMKENAAGDWLVPTYDDSRVAFL